MLCERYPWLNCRIFNFICIYTYNNILLLKREFKKKKKLKFTNFTLWVEHQLRVEDLSLVIRNKKIIAIKSVFLFSYVCKQTTFHFQNCLSSGVLRLFNEYLCKKLS